MDEATVNNISDKLQQAFSALAEQLGVATDYFWPLFVKQQVVEGIVATALYFALVLFVGVCIILAWKIKDKLNEQEGGIGNVVFGLVLLFSFAIFAANSNALVEAITKIFNPEYHAIQEVMKMVK